MNLLLDYSNLTKEKLIEIKNKYLSENVKINDKVCLIQNEDLNWNNLFGESISFNDTFTELFKNNIKGEFAFILLDFNSNTLNN